MAASWFSSGYRSNSRTYLGQILAKNEAEAIKEGAKRIQAVSCCNPKLPLISAGGMSCEMPTNRLNG